MSNYILLAETGSDIPAEIAEQYQIQTVPMHVTLGDETRDDGTFPVEDIYSYFDRTGNLARTSGCTVGDFEQAFDRIQSQYPGKHILHLAYSAATTCSYQSALLAAEGRTGISSIDTKQVSAGQSLVLIEMARYLEEHPDCSLEEATAKAQELGQRCHMGFFPGDLAYLRAGGRVSNAAYLGARILSLHPLIEVLDGKLKATQKYRGKMLKAAPKLLNDFVEQYQLDRERIVFVYSAGLNQSIKDEMNALAQEMGFQEILWIQTGGVVTTHCGPGGFGVCGLSKKV